MTPRLLQLLALLMVLSPGAFSAAADFPPGVTSLEQSFQCPIDGEAWKQRVETSTRATGLRLDLRKLGAIVQPPTLPQCPKCRFVLFTDTLDETATSKLKAFILGGDYQAVAMKSPPYAALAQIQEFTGAAPVYIGYSYLRASWQVEEKPVICQRYLGRAYDHFRAALAEMKPEHRDRLNIALLCGELERRLERWEDAERRFRALQESEDFQKEPRMQPIIAMQMKLLADRDSRPHALNAAGAPSPQVPLTLSTPVAPVAPSPPPPTDPRDPLDLSRPLTLDGASPPR